MNEYIGFALAVALLISSPGPIVALVLTDGRTRFPIQTILGGALSAQVLLILALALIFFAIGVSHLVLALGQVAGGVYLLWTGLTLLSSKEGSSLKWQDGSFLRAFLVGISNPKDIVFFLAFLPSFLSLSAPFFMQAATLLLIWAVIDISILVSYGLVAKRLHAIERLNALTRYLPGIAVLAIGAASLMLGARSLYEIVR